ncbi:tetraspanin-2 isoform X2 [Rana temporaria]|uniref:tetraspanin-2 isoform X2 n=1 Tax=Rana temporaria TaxID=8407 RepID=UPI001AACC8F6|nr:tetraspanin-2 isoform X2 [Rana temporaria]
MGRLSGSLQCVKYLLLTFNLIFLLAGSAIVAVGLWILFTGNIKELSEGDEEVYVFFFAGLYVLVGAGALMMLIGFFGCCGAARESQCLLGATIIDAQGLYTKAYDDYIKNGGRNETLQDFHTFAKCCGNADPESAQRVRSLCLEEHKEHKNCLEEIAKMLNHSFQIVGILAVATAGVTIFGMIFSMVLCCAIRNSREML